MQCRIYLYAFVLTPSKPTLNSFRSFSIRPKRVNTLQHKSAARVQRCKISQPKLEEMRILVPTIPEQRRIVVELDALQAEVDALKRLQTETAEELDALLPSILDRAFKGEL